MNEKARSAERGAYERILVVRLDRIGDVLLSTPVFKALRDAFPASHIACMVRPYAADIVTGNPYLNEVILYDKHGPERGLRGNAAFIARLRAKRFDLVIVLHPTTRAHLVTFFAGIPERIGYDRKAGRFLTVRVPHAKEFGLKHEIDYTLDLVRHIGVEPADRQLYMPVNRVSEERVGRIFADAAIGSRTVVAIHPGASCPSKRWPITRFAEVARALLDRPGVAIVVIAGPADAHLGDDLAGRLKGCVVNLSGKTSVADVASVLRRSQLFISNDSGPVHIASAVGTPVIAIFGRQDRGLSPERWGPVGKRDRVLHKDVGCVVCRAHGCETGFRCLEAITADDVLRLADEIIASAHPVDRHTDAPR